MTDPDQTTSPLEALIVTAARDAFSGALRRARTAEAIEIALAELWRTTSDLVERNLASAPPPSPIHCKAGCIHCCLPERFSVTDPELIAIGHGLDPAARESVQHRAGRPWIDLETGRPTPCPLLDESGRCAVYPVRPFVCRGLNSLDVTACEASVGKSVHPPVPLYHPQRAIQVAAQGGVMLGIADLDLPGAGRYLDLRAAVPILLETPDAAERWLGGEDVFAAAALKSVQQDPERGSP